jgi:hypothetical protein
MPAILCNGLAPGDQNSRGQTWKRQDPKRGGLAADVKTAGRKIHANRNGQRPENQLSPTPTALICALVSAPTLGLFLEIKLKMARYFGRGSHIAILSPLVD